jgi:hypothetical protein
MAEEFAEPADHDTVVVPSFNKFPQKLFTALLAQGGHYLQAVQSW